MAVISAFIEEVLFEIEESFSVKPEGCARFMKKVVLLTIILFIMVSVIGLPAAANEDQYLQTRTAFSYMGKIFYEKEYTTFGGSGYLKARGMGTFEGYHFVFSKEEYRSAAEYVYASSNVIATRTNYIDLHVSGSTFPDNSLELAQIERDTIANLEAMRTAEIAELNRLLQAGMIQSEYERLMTAVNSRYDALVLQVHAEFSESKQNMRIESKVDVKDSSIYAGIEMNPGETGYIKKSVAHKSESSGGEYLRADSHIKNTGGITGKKTSYGMGDTTYIKEDLLVIGSADLWESTRMQKGNVKTGWWDATP